MSPEKFVHMDSVTGLVFLLKISSGSMCVRQAWISFVWGESLVQKHKSASPHALALNSGEDQTVQFFWYLGCQGSGDCTSPGHCDVFPVLCVPGVASMDVAAWGPCSRYSAEISMEPTGPVTAAFVLKGCGCSSLWDAENCCPLSVHIFGKSPGLKGCHNITKTNNEWLSPSGA